MNQFVEKLKDMKESCWAVILGSANNIAHSDESMDSDEVAGDLSMISNHCAVLYILGSPKKA